jgi:hypothetical protein
MINSRLDETYNFLLSGFKEYQVFQLRLLTDYRFDTLSNQNTSIAKTLLRKKIRGKQQWSAIRQIWYVNKSPVN